MILSSDYRSDAVVNEIGQAFSGTSTQYAGGGLQKKFYELKLPEVKEPASAWQMWTKEHADFIRRHSPQQAAAK